MLQIEKKDLPEYKYETASVRDAYNKAASGLEEMGLISLEWISGRPVLTRIILCLDRVDDCYRLLGRQHPKVLAEAVAETICKALMSASTPWILAWAKDVCLNARETCRVPPYCRDNLTFLSGLLQALAAYDGLHRQVITMRAFSARCYRDTKRFEQEFRDEFLRIAQKYDTGLHDACEHQDMGSRDKLSFLGIYPRPELYEFSGNCAVLTERGSIDLSALYPYGIALPSTALQSIKGFIFRQIKTVVFIENKTNYDEYLIRNMCPDELVVYHGGFLSPLKRQFVERLTSALSSEVKIYFWADIDLGGFKMFMQLQQIIPALLPMNMSGEAVYRMRSSSLVRTQEYLSQLKKCLEDENFCQFQDAIQAILDIGATIEQEAFLSD